MPQIPRAADISRVVPNAQQRIVVTGGQTAINNAVQQRGNLITGIAQDFAQDAARKRLDEKQKKDRYEMMQAKTNFYKGSVALDNAFDDDPDYETVPARYSKGAAELAETAAESISDPALRSEFLMDSEMKAAAGFERIQQVAKRTEVDAQRGFMDSQIADIREAGLQGDVREAMDYTAEIIEAGVQSGYYSVEEGGDMLRAAQTDLAVAKLEMMAPEEQLEALSTPWAQNIPSDIRASLQRVAQKKTDESTAILFVDDLKAQKVGQTEALAAIAQIEDLDVRVLAERRYNTERQLMQNAKDDEAKEIYQQYFAPIAAGDSTLADLSDEEMLMIEKNVTPAMLSNLYAVDARQRERKDVETPPELRRALNLAFDGGHGDPAEVARLYNENSALLSNSDDKIWSAVTPSDFEAVKNNPVFAGKEQIQNAMIEVYGYEDTEERNVRQSKLERDYERFVLDYREANGKDPDPETQRSYIEKITLRLPTRGRRGPGNSPADFQQFSTMTPEKKRETLQYIRSQDPVSYQKAVDIAGPGADPDDVAYLFSIMSDIDDAP